MVKKKVPSKINGIYYLVRTEWPYVSMPQRYLNTVRFDYIDGDAFNFEGITNETYNWIMRICIYKWVLIKFLTRFSIPIKCDYFFGSEELFWLSTLTMIRLYRESGVLSHSFPTFSKGSILIIISLN